MLMPGRRFTTSTYRYGFNGKENDNNVKGEGNEQDYGMRIYDSRIGKFLSVDPLAKKYPELTPYQFASNTPIQGVDLDGKEVLHYLLTFNNGKPKLEYQGVEKRAPGSGPGGNPFTDILDCLFSNYKDFEGPEHKTLSIEVWVRWPDGQRYSMVFNSLGGFEKWAKAGYPKKPIEVFDDTEGDQAALQGMFMVMSQAIDNADGDNDGYVRANNYNKGNSSPDVNTSKQATAANNGNLNPAKSNTAANSKGAKGEYGKFGGHHVHAKAAFKSNINYDPNKGFSISQSYMNEKGWNHQAMTNKQRELFKELAASGKSNTLAAHSNIAVESLRAGGATLTEARSLVAESLNNLRQQGVIIPSNIPWYK